MDLKTYIDTNNAKAKPFNEWDLLVIQSFNENPEGKTLTDADKANAMYKVQLKDFVNNYLKNTEEITGASLVDQDKLTSGINNAKVYTDTAINNLSNVYLKKEEDIQSSKVITDTTSKKKLDATLNEIKYDISQLDAGSLKLNSKITAEETRAKSVEGVPREGKTLQSEIIEEESRAKAAEGTLTTNLDSEVARAKAAEGTLTTNLNNEITRAKGAEETLTTNLNNEITRAKGKEGEVPTGKTLQGEIDAVEARLDVIEGDDTTTGSIAKALKDAKVYTDEEVTRATGAETALGARIDNLKLTEPSAIEGDAGSFIATISQDKGQIAATKIKFIENITSGSTAMVAPTTKAIVNYIDSKSTVEVGAVNSSTENQEDNINALIEAGYDPNKQVEIEGKNYFKYSAGDTASVNVTLKEEGKEEVKFTQRYQIGLTEEGYKRRAKKSDISNGRRWVYVGNTYSNFSTRQSAALNSGIDSIWKGSVDTYMSSETSTREGADTTLQSNIDVVFKRTAKSTEPETYEYSGYAKNYTDDEIKKLDATPSHTSADGLTLNLTQVDGKVTAISGSIAANTYDKYGSAETAKSNAQGYTDSSIAALDATVGSTTVASGKHVAVQVKEENGKLTSCTVTESDIASAALLGTTSDTSAKTTAFGYIKKESVDRANAITNAINALDASKSQASASTNGYLSLSITETDGKITAFGGSVDSSKYDAAGTAETKANAALASAKTYADGLGSKYATKAQGTKADNALPTSGGTLTGDLKSRNIDATGSKISANTFVAVSARDKKENVLPFDKSGLDIINNTDIVSFNYKEDPEKSFKVGFIADDTDAILSTKEHNTMDITSCIGVLMKAVQELSAKNKQLEEKIKGLENNG